MPQDTPQLLLLVFLAGCILGSVSVWGRVASRLRASQPALPLRDCPRTPPAAVYVPLAMFVWVAAPLVAVTILAVDPDPPLNLDQVRAHCLSSTMVVLLLLSAIAFGGSASWSRFGIDFAGWKRDLVDGACGFLASVLPVGLVLVATYRLRSPETQHSFLQLLREHPGPETTLWIVLGAVVLAPLAEELVYRVILQGWLQSKIEPPRAIAAVALLFALVHGWPDSLPLIPLSLILGYVYYRRHSYLAVVVLHMLFNAANLALALLAQQAEAAGPVVTSW